MNHQQRDAILAGLRLLQQRIDDGENIADIADIADIYTDTGRHEGLSSDGIDELCETINAAQGLCSAFYEPWYTQLEIEHCVHAENRWGESFVEAIHDLERASLSDVLEEFWTIYGRHPDGRAEALHDTGDHTQAYIIAMLLSRVAFSKIPVVDNSPEGKK